MERVAASRPPLILDDGTHTMDLLYIDDVTRSSILERANTIMVEA
jgi:UDP-glucose 4-epimerase